MTEYSFFESFTEQIQQATAAEWLAVIFGILQVWFSRLNKSIHYIFGLIGIIISVYVLFHAKLYAEILLHLYYLIMSIYGWFYWRYGSATVVPISRCAKSDWWIVGFICIGGFLAFYFGLVHLTDSDVPLWDSIVSCTAWAGMWLLAKRKLENWLLLNLSNLVAIPLLLHKGLFLYAGLTLFLFVMAFGGYFNWRKILNDEKIYAT
ncbi:nicotinamide riboside transporter PnuC [Sphingobacterium sp. InxBP1]|uniref:nicotinamide riboside transporter PnuC n=1 Tax=Sphingobacterium sp. InxBP1 TaxID=2870328 RepID=UPI00224491B5|nr:nicotinamide riboside transporter PnuC [Sphingobacterium sp. InxBP1]MCW8311317.1 nicotinamide riboside transporter PnuC [Sphingobacterium sp. InxBP1]